MLVLFGDVRSVKLLMCILDLAYMRCAIALNFLPDQDIVFGPMQTDSSLPEPGFIFHTYFTPTHFLHCVHMNPVNPIDSAVVHPPRLLVALWCYRQLKKTEKKTGACYQNNI